jgi:transcriptional regulator with XRE-family HTH domain
MGRPPSKPPVAKPKRTLSPRVVDLRPGASFDLDLVPVGHASFVWSPNPDFATYLRRIRERARISLRQAAPALGVSYAWLARTETGGYASAPSLARLRAIAELYGVDMREVLHEAGVRVDVPVEVTDAATLDERFKAMVLHPALRPALLDEEALAYIPERVKRQWLEFAEKLSNCDAPDHLMREILDIGRGDG